MQKLNIKMEKDKSKKGNSHGLTRMYTDIRFFFNLIKIKYGVGGESVPISENQWLIKI
jgi:hypothetical protein